MTLCIPNLPPTTRAKDVDVALTPSAVCVTASSTVKLEGSFERKVNASESLWSLSTDDATKRVTLEISLEKVEKTWWSSPIAEDEYKIDCSKVDSTMKVDQYDEKTQGKIREIMWQQAEERRKIASGEIEAPRPPHEEEGRE